MSKLLPFLAIAFGIFVFSVVFSVVIELYLARLGPKPPGSLPALPYILAMSLYCVVGTGLISMSWCGVLIDFDYESWFGKYVGQLLGFLVFLMGLVLSFAIFAVIGAIAGFIGEQIYQEFLSG